MSIRCTFSDTPRLSIRALALAFAMSLTCSLPGGETLDKEHVSFHPFIAYGASASAEELVAVAFQQVDGKLSARIVQRAALGFEGAPVLFHSKRRLLYVAALRAKKETPDDFRLRAFQVGLGGQLKKRFDYRLKHGSAFMSFDRTGEFLLSASYFSGHVDVYRFKSDGSVATAVATVFEGKKFAHSILVSPDNRSAYVPYVKDNNAMHQYSFDAKSGGLRPLKPSQAKVPKGAGPRHVAYHPQRRLVFFSNEQQLGATSYRLKPGGQLEFVRMARPGDLQPGAGLAAADIEVSKTGKFVFVAVRDFGKKERDRLCTYRTSNDGGLEFVTAISCDSIPWGLHLSPGGKYLLMTAAHGNTLTAYAINKDGSLTKSTSLEWGNMIRDLATVVVKP